MLKIGEFANLFNITIKTVRFYEEKELIKPFYIDKYSGYRYYDENNINQMSRILYLKKLGFALNEIKNYNEDQIKNKIEEYENKIIKLRNDIHDLTILKDNPQKELHKRDLNQKDKLEKIKKIDKFNGIYKTDYRLIGFWKTVGFLENNEKFRPRFMKLDENCKLEKITVNPYDNTVLIHLKNQEPFLSKYTKDYIFNIFIQNTMCKYKYQRVNGKTYIILENKSEEYIDKNKIHGYYVLEKIGGNYMEGVFESKDKINTILSEEKKGLLLGKNIYLPNGKRGNINTLVVAGCGGGKSASFVIPNILNCLGSYVVTDPLGEVYEKTYKYLENNGYEVLTINYDKGLNDYKYNPLNHLKEDVDIDILADIIMNNVDDVFWNDATKYLFKAIIYYVLLKEEKKDLLTCFKMMSLEKDKLFEKLDELDLGTKGYMYYSIIKIYPEKTYASVVSTAISKLAFVINKISENMNFDTEIDFSDITKKKMAIFLTSKENYKEDKIITNIFISQLLSQLNRVENPIEHTYFLLDEVDQLDRIYELPRSVQTSRSKKISVSLIVNTLNKLKEIYGNDFYLIMNSIDSQLLLGTNLNTDIEYFSELLGIDEDFIKNDLEKDKLLIYEKGLKPILAEKDYFFMREEWSNI